MELASYQPANHSSTPNNPTQTMQIPNLHNPDTYVTEAPHEAFAYLRQNQPVYWQDIPDDTGYWMVLRHADVVHVAREPEIFSAELGGVVVETMEPAQLESMRNMLLAMDPPRHTAWRRNIAPHFKVKVIAEMEQRIREITRDILAHGREMGEVDFVHDVCAHLPSNVMGEIMGIPDEDREQIHKWAEQQAGGQDPDINPDGYENVGSQASIEMAMYAIEHAKQRREKRASGDESNPDMTDLVMAAEVDGRTMTDIDFGSFFVQLVTAGNDTTRTMLSGGTLALLAHPDQLAELRADHSLIPSTVEEVLRWANPLHYFRRTTTQDTEVAGQPIEANQKVVMVYTSANRDEAVFDDPDSFNIHRSPNPHLSFGIGQHFCLGVHLARLEGRVFFEELLSAFSDMELIGEPQRARSNLNNSLKHLPLRLAA